MPQQTCFKPFDQSLADITFPEHFPSPFASEPHPICRVAASELQGYLSQQTDWVHDFGIEHFVEGSNIGKMFGVLVAIDSGGQIGYISAFSGKLAGANHHPGFVPPVADLLQPGGFYRLGEEYISTINRQICDIEHTPEYIHCAEQHRQLVISTSSEQERYRSEMKAAKQHRDRIRAEAVLNMSQSQLAELKESLKSESLKWQYDYKLLVRNNETLLAESTDRLAGFADRLRTLKEERKSQSAALQQRMFEEYSFLNAKGQTKSLRDIFDGTAQGVPPAGAGDCAGPKLLQYAFLHGLRPIAMAEFWWGQPPSSEMRRHGHFYPACRGKCLPILGHMIVGLPLQATPVMPSAPALDIVYRDEHIVIINKQPELLSVPGKSEAPSVYSIARQMFPDAEEPIIVHRLDMSTSGLMVLALTLKAYHSLQQQFVARTVKKEYTAVLEGAVVGDHGQINIPMRPNIDDRPRQMVCTEYGKPAETFWTVMGRKNGRTLLRFEPVTGRTHQLRVHAAHPQGLNCPIVGDDLYGQACGRLHLHASYLEFEHPYSGKRLKFESAATFGCE